MTPVPDQPRPDAPRRSYDALFGDEVDAGPVAYDDPVPVDSEPYLPPAARPPEAVDAAPARVRAARPVDTGRLYHSRGADAADTGALPALPTGDAAEPVVVPVATAVAGAAGVPDPPPARMEAIAAPPAAVAVTDAAPQPTADRPPKGGLPAGDAGARGLTYLGVVTVIGVPTFLVGLAQALIWDHIGWLTGLVLLLTTAYAAYAVRRPDMAAAVVVPPLAFLVTTLVAGQLTLPAGRSLAVREGYMIVRTLAENAPWVIGATVLAAVVVLVRRRRG